MKKKIISLIAMAGLVGLMGAACTVKTTVTSGNLNVSTSATVNTALGNSNSHTTGTFETEPTVVVNQ